MWIKHGNYLALYGLNATLAAENAFLKEANESLKRRVKEMVERLDQERQRSDEAVDQMLRVKGMPTVSPTEKPPTLEQLTSLFEEDPTEVREIVNAIKERGPAEVLLESE